MLNPLTRRRLLGIALAAMLPAPVLAQAGPELVEMTMGDADAPVTVVEYASFTCPHCARFHADVMPQLRENFIDTGQVQLVFREVYFDRPGLWASMIARCAGPDRYFGVVDLLFRRQSEWASGEDTDIVQSLYAIGRQAGLTDEEMNACTQDREFAQALVESFQTNATRDGVDATPTFMINGEKASNMSYADFEARLNEELGL